jgi:hypothetical protein
MRAQDARVQMGKVQIKDRFGLHLPFHWQGDEKVNRLIVRAAPSDPGSQPSGDDLPVDVFRWSRPGRLALSSWPRKR